MKLKLLRGFALFFALLYLPFPAYAFSFSNLYVFGDSLSDQGNISTLTGGVIPPAEYTDGSTTGRFTNGKNYVDYLAQDLGLTVTPSLLGGTNYAYGGARTNYHILPPPALSLIQQRDAYLAHLGGGTADPNALYIVWAGANNLSDILTNLQTNPLYNPYPDLASAGADIAGVIASLAASGVRHIIAPNIPDLGLVPGVTGGGPPNPQVSGLVFNFNLGLENALQGIALAYPNTDITPIDTFSLLDDLYLNPAAHGLSNVSDACYSAYVVPGGTTCANPDQYIFWDLDHPTTATHRILAADMLRSIPEPGSVALMCMGLIALAIAGKRGRTSTNQISIHA